MLTVWREPETSCARWGLMCAIRLICGRWISPASAGFQLCRVPSPPKRHSCLPTRVLLWIGLNPTWRTRWRSFSPRQLLARLFLKRFVATQTAAGDVAVTTVGHTIVSTAAAVCPAAATGAVKTIIFTADAMRRTRAHLGLTEAE